MRRQDFISILRISDMKYYLILIGTLMGQLNAQDTFWDVKNFSDSGSEEPYHMEIRNDTVFVWGRGTCDEEECMQYYHCLLYTSPSPRDQRGSRMPSSA